MDECTDIALLVIFTRAATVDFDEFLDMASLSSTTTGHDNCEHVIRAEKKFELNPANLHGLITDGASSLTGRTNGKEIKLDAVGAQDVIISH